MAGKGKKNYNKKRRDYYLKKRGPGLSPQLPLGQSYKLHTRYVDYNISIDPGLGGTPSTHVFSLNGLYDPDISGVGHQPLGFDQLVGVMYNHYTVVGARARVTCTNTDTSNAQLAILQIKDTTTTSTDIDNILENGKNRWALLPPEGSGPNSKTLSINCSMRNFFGRDIMQSTTYQGTSSSNPGDGVFLHITASPQFNSDTTPLACCVVIEYIAMLTEPKQLASS